MHRTPEAFNSQSLLSLPYIYPPDAFPSAKHACLRIWGSAYDAIPLYFLPCMRISFKEQDKFFVNKHLQSTPASVVFSTDKAFTDWINLADNECMVNG